jgi:hypothetical protein
MENEMSIQSRETVRVAFERLQTLHADPEDAIDAVAQLLALPREVVAECLNTSV